MGMNGILFVVYGALKPSILNNKLDLEYNINYEINDQMSQNFKTIELYK